MAFESAGMLAILHDRARKIALHRDRTAQQRARLVRAPARAAETAIDDHRTGSAVPLVARLSTLMGAAVAQSVADHFALVRATRQATARVGAAMLPARQWTLANSVAEQFQTCGRSNNVRCIVVSPGIGHGTRLALLLPLGWLLRRSTGRTNHVLLRRLLLAIALGLGC